VRAEFLHAWNGYKKYAWGHDDLKPLSKSFDKMIFNIEAHPIRRMAEARPSGRASF
jgi:hypothetical protein